MKIVYVGLKEIKADNVAGTGLTWTRGEVHEVADEKKCAKLLEHSMIWANASGKSEPEIASMLIPAPKVVDPSPRVSFVPQDATSPYWEPVVIVIPGEVFDRLQKQEIQAVFMTPADADAYADWKLEKETRPADDVTPKNTGPKAQAKETKAGLESKKAA